jgi:hypothetical protein
MAIGVITQQVGLLTQSQDFSSHRGRGLPQEIAESPEFFVWHGPCIVAGIIGTIPITGPLTRRLASLTKGIFAMNNFDFSAARSFLAAAAIALVSTTMLFAATAVPSVAAASSSIA